MLTYSGSDGELTLADLEREFAGWVCWRGLDGLFYGRRQESPEGSYDAHGDFPADLREAILLARGEDVKGSTARGGQVPQAPDAAPADLGYLADLDALAGELNERRFHALLLAPPGELPYVDVSLPGSMAPGERIYAHGGTFYWAGTWPIGPASQPAAVAAEVARVLQPAPHHSDRDGEPTLADLVREFPGWTFSENFGWCYATREPIAGQKDVVRGEDPLDLHASVLVFLRAEEYEREAAQDTSPGIPA